MRRTLTLIMILMISLQLSGREIIYVSDYGIKPDSGMNIVPAVKALLKEIHKNPRPVELRFESGRYDIWWEDNDPEKEGYKFLFNFKGLDSLYFNACGAQFVGHGIFSLISCVNCKNPQISSFSLDWDRPLISQGEIRGFGDGYVDISFDKKQYPYVIRDSKAFFTGENWERQVHWRSFSNIFDPATGYIFPGIADCYLSNWGNTLFNGKAEEIGDSTIRFFGKVEHTVPVGSIIALYNGTYYGDVLAFHRCTDIQVSDLDIYHSMGMGIIANYCENLLVDNVRFLVNKEKGRYFGMISDAIHFGLCRGLVEIRNCDFEGQGDDCLNTHGRYQRIDSVNGHGSIKLNLIRGGLHDLPNAGDKIWVIDKNTVQRKDTLTVCSVKRLTDTTAMVYFKGGKKGCASSGDYVENASWFADLKFHHNHCGHTNRARGIMFTSPGKIEVYNNLFESSGSAILAEGDINYWYESGALRNVDIHHNCFRNCATSVKNSQSAGWGNAVIGFSPSHHPDSPEGPFYHHNIRIHDNRFEIWDEAIVYARSVSGLVFKDNEIVRTKDICAPAQSQRANISLDGCYDTLIDENVTVEIK